MSLTRTALRLQAIEALNSDPTILAMVQGRVYDSRIGDITTRNVVPIILVTTEETKGEAWSQQNGGMPFGLSCDLVLEVAMNLVSGQGPEATAGIPATDRNLEALLDLIEECAVRVLTVGETPAARILSTVVVRRVAKVASSRFSTDEVGVRLAIRLLTLTVEMLTPPEDEPFAPPVGVFGGLPEPLRTVAVALPTGSSSRELCERLADLLAPGSAPAGPPSFAGVDLLVAPQPLHPTDPPDRASDLVGGGTFAAPVTLP